MVTKKSRHARWGLTRICALATFAAACEGADINGAPAEGVGGPQEILEVTQALAVGTQLDCAGGIDGTCTMKSMPRLWQTDPAVDVDVTAMGPFGCYDASMATVLTTALGNRTALGALQNRTASWNNITPGNNGAMPPLATTKAQEQLSQEYRWAKAYHDSGHTDPNKQAFHFPEMLDDFRGTSRMFPDGCNPRIYGSCHWLTKLDGNNLQGAAFRDFTANTAHVTNDYVKTLMRDGFAAMVAYQRNAPRAVMEGGQLVLRFDVVGQHKVAFSGYQPGAFPLLINDVGDGNSYRVTLGNKLSSARTYAGYNLWQFNKVYLPNGASQQTFIEYNTNPADTNVNFVEHVDALSLALPKPGFMRQVWSYTWGAGWTSFMPFVQNGKPHAIIYNATTGEVQFDRFFPNAQGVEALWQWTWGAGWSHFAPYTIADKPYFTVYNTSTGEMQYLRVRDSTLGADIYKQKYFPAGYTSVTPFKYAGMNHLLMYNKNTGAVRFERLAADGKDSTTVWTWTWGAGWTDFVVHYVNDYPYLVAYNATSGLTHYNRFWEGLNGVQGLTVTTLPTGLSLSALSALGPAQILSVNRATGLAKIKRVELDGSNSGDTASNYLLSRATSVVPFRQDGKSYVMLYDGSSGRVRSYEMTVF